MALVWELAIREGKSLAPKDVGGTSDPYCVIIDSADGSQPSSDAVKHGKRTPVIYKTLNPEWSFRLSRSLSAPFFTNAQCLYIQVWDEDKVTADDFMGQIVLKVGEQVQLGQWTKGWMPVQTRPGKKDNVSGSLYVEVYVAQVASIPASFKNALNTLDPKLNFPQVWTALVSNKALAGEVQFGELVGQKLLNGNSRTVTQKTQFVVHRWAAFVPESPLGPFKGSQFYDGKARDFTNLQLSVMEGKIHVKWSADDYEELKMSGDMVSYAAHITSIFLGTVEVSAGSATLQGSVIRQYQCSMKDGKQETIRSTPGTFSFKFSLGDDSCSFSFGVEPLKLSV